MSGVLVLDLRVLAGARDKVSNLKRLSAILDPTPFLRNPLAQ
jgi:hypothetical protein